jgi:plastocyanin
MRPGGLLLAAVLGLTGPAALAQGGAPGGGGRVAGHVVILDRDNKPAPDVGDAVVYLEGAGPPARPVTAEIAISDKVYVPHVVVVPAGSTVRFPNHDPFNHNVFSVSEPNGFDLGLYGRGEAKAQTFTAPGLVRVFCNVHPRMVAYVVVLGNRWFAQPAGDGAFTISDVPPGRYRLHVWHERVAAEVVKEVVVTSQGAADIQVALNARGYKWQPHKNKYGRDYPTNAGRERY